MSYKIFFLLYYKDDYSLNFKKILLLFVYLVILMNLLYASVATSFCLIFMSLMFKKSKKNEFILNEELEKYYSIPYDQTNLKMKQLLEAAKHTIRQLEKYSDENKIITELYDDRVLSDDFFNKFKKIEENLIVEKTIIENEADLIKTGLKDFIFLEAKKQVLNQPKVKGEKLFDETLFLKKIDILQKNLKSNLNIK